MRIKRVTAIDQRADPYMVAEVLHISFPSGLDLGDLLLKLGIRGLEIANLPLIPHELRLRLRVGPLELVRDLDRLCLDERA
jgi:hypothetical protein